MLIASWQGLVARQPSKTRCEGYAAGTAAPAAVPLSACPGHPAGTAAAAAVEARQHSSSVNVHAQLAFAERGGPCVVLVPTAGSAGQVVDRLRPVAASLQTFCRFSTGVAAVGRAAHWLLQHCSLLLQVSLVLQDQA